MYHSTALSGGHNCCPVLYTKPVPSLQFPACDWLGRGVPGLCFPPSWGGVLSPRTQVASSILAQDLVRYVVCSHTEDL